MTETLRCRARAGIERRERRERRVVAGRVVAAGRAARRVGWLLSLALAQAALGGGPAATRPLEPVAQRSTERTGEQVAGAAAERREGAERAEPAERVERSERIPGIAREATPLTPALRAQVQAAVAHYEAGRLREAAREFAALARRAVPAAQYNLGVMHLRGELADASTAEAERWLLLAARGGFVTAMFTLGRAFEGGELGRRDLVLAHDWYELAAERGSVEAMVAMGTAYYIGRGRASDAAAAARWYREAAKGGDIGAQYLIASMYESGEGVSRDLRLARHWYREAARQGDEAAPAKLREIERRMADEERAGAAVAPVAASAAQPGAMAASSVGR